MKVLLGSLLPTLAILALASPLQPHPRDEAPRACNLNPAVCDRKYSNVSYIGTHNSAFHSPDLADPRTNQDLTVSQQLDAGIRFLQAQVHEPPEALGDIGDAVGDVFGDDCGSGLRMCHTDCLLYDVGSLEGYLKEVKAWLDAEGHGDEIVTMLLVNGDSSPVGDFAAAFESTGLADIAFIPSTSPAPLAPDAWPTLGQMIDAGKRLVVFLSTAADESSTPYLLSEFDHYFFETPFETTDPAFSSCALDRPGGADAEGRMYVLNHFLQREILPDVLVPAKDEAARTNAAVGEGSVGAHVALCEGQWGRVPTFVLMDVFEVGGEGGGVFEVQGAMNGF